MKIVVVGIGNELRGDDGAGPEFVRTLKSVRTLKENNIHDIISHFPDLSLAELIKDYDVVIFADVSVDSNKVEIEEINQAKTYSLSHHFSIENIFWFCKKVYNHNLKGYILKIPGYDFGYKKAISEEAKRNIEQAIEIFELFIKNFSLKRGDKDGKE